MDRDPFLRLAQVRSNDHTHSVYSTARSSEALAWEKEVHDAVERLEEVRLRE